MDFIEELKFLKEQLKFTERVRIPKRTKNVVMAGMGGSGIAGKIFQEFYSSMPTYLVDDYNIPDFVSESTLFIATSYSGNTEETLNATKNAIKKGAYVVTISSGGKLIELGHQRIRIPRRDLQPRSVTGYMLMPLLNGFRIISGKEINRAYKLLAELDKNNSQCLGHAKELFKSKAIPIIYGASPFKSMAYRWKTQFNENSKIIGYSNSFPELNHNDTMALALTSLKNHMYFMVFGSDDNRISKRIKITSQITKSNFNIITPQGRTPLEKMFYLLHYGDYVTYHFGILRKVSPTDVSLIEKLKLKIG
ncbi:MAG: bifunctional phosphoglucose/phosphomannose isomerase [Candidatus Marsarchaeota archaeon]|nr:bifunctional phosphoglucose/phosphomannose isomerase [Candidatus Marsarchaeota archaeon]MCL5413393.1 bifunctional phosphoglucose/phosphomannose isomerase [Candidatus Marsarchaeota archaeon]